MQKRTDRIVALIHAYMHTVSSIGLPFRSSVALRMFLPMLSFVLVSAPLMQGCTMERRAQLAHLFLGNKAIGIMPLCIFVRLKI